MLISEREIKTIPFPCTLFRLVIVHFMLCVVIPLIDEAIRISSREMNWTFFLFSMLQAE